MSLQKDLNVLNKFGPDFFKWEGISQEEMVKKLKEKLVYDEDIDEAVEQDSEGFKNLVIKSLKVQEFDYTLFDYLISTAPVSTNKVAMEYKEYLDMYMKWLIKMKTGELVKRIEEFIQAKLANLVEIYLGNGGLVTASMNNIAVQTDKEEMDKDSKTILELISHKYEWISNEYFQRKFKFCQLQTPNIDDMLLPMISSEYKITIPSWTILPRNFKKEYLTTLPPLKYDIVTSTITSSNYYEGYNSILNDNKFTFDLEWIQECNRYLSKLSISDKFTVYGYTHKGDEVAHSYIIDPKIDLAQKISKKK